MINYSRTELKIFLNNTTIWLVWAAIKFNHNRQITITTSVLALILAAFFVSGGALLERFAPLVEGEWTVSGDLRFQIQEDALGVASSAPWCGQGLGSFETLFAHSREASLAEKRVLHPESDWL